MKLIWSKESLNRLIEIEEFISKDNPIIAEEFIDFIILKSEVLVGNPESGRIVPEISNPQIRELIIRNYRIVYRVQDKHIEILTVFEAHRLLRRSEILPNE